MVTSRQIFNACMPVGLIAMTVGAWILFGAGVGLIVFGALVWGGTAIAAAVTIAAARGKAQAD